MFEKFNSRFDTLNDNLNIIAENKLLPDGITADSVIQDYVNLCSEEFLAFTEGLVSQTVWESWRNGISFYLKSDAILQIFTREKSRASNSYYGLFSRQEGLKSIS